MLPNIVRVVLPFSASETSTKANMAQRQRVNLMALILLGLIGCVATSTQTPEEAWQAVRRADAEFAQLIYVGETAGEAPPANVQALFRRQHELKQWVYPLVTSYLPPGIPLPRQIRLVKAEETPFEAYGDVIDVELGARTEDQAWTHLVKRLYEAGLSNLAAGKLTELPLPLTKIRGRPVRSNSALNRNLLSCLWVEGTSSFVAAHGERLANHGSGVLSWQQRSLITPHYMDLRDILASDEDAKERWAKLLRLDDSETLFSRIGANMAGRLERELGVEGLVLAIGRGPEGFYSGFMALYPGALVSFELAPEVQGPPAPEPPLRVTH